MEDEDDDSDECDKTKEQKAEEKRIKETKEKKEGQQEQEEKEQQDEKGTQSPPPPDLQVFSGASPELGPQLQEAAAHGENVCSPPKVSCVLPYSVAPQASQSPV